MVAYQAICRSMFVSTLRLQGQKYHCERLSTVPWSVKRAMRTSLYGPTTASALDTKVRINLVHASRTQHSQYELSETVMSHKFATLRIVCTQLRGPLCIMHNDDARTSRKKNNYMLSGQRAIFLATKNLLYAAPFGAAVIHHLLHSVLVVL